MARNAQAQPKRLSVMTIGFAAALLLAPSAAWAGSGHNDYDRHRTSRHYESRHADAHHYHASHKRHHHASHKRHHRAIHKGHDRGFHKGHHRGKRRGHAKHYAGYYCRPCDHYFDARDELYGHVAYRHRVPSRHLEVAVSFGEFGWIFFGG
jgi:hypothetical protein